MCVGTLAAWLGNEQRMRKERKKRKTAAPLSFRPKLLDAALLGMLQLQSAECRLVRRFQVSPVTDLAILTTRVVAGWRPPSNDGRVSEWKKWGVPVAIIQGKEKEPSPSEVKSERSCQHHLFAVVHRWA